MKQKIKNFWSSLTPQGKKRLVSASIIVTLLAVGIAGYEVSRSSTPQPPPQQKVKKESEITLEPKLLEKSLYMESQKELQKRDEKIAELEKEVEEIKNFKKSAPLPTQPPLPEIPPSSTLPPPPPPPPPTTQTPPQPPKIESVGGIAWFSGEAAKEEVKKEEDKKKLTVYLPTSFMEATLLSGLDAPVVQEAKGNPVPVLLRIKDLAILPNKVKANLKGCFVVAEGYGNLADERAHLRLISLSCIAKNGQAVIDQKIKGFIVDKDGKVGLRGTVVSKLGSMVARSALAGFIGGVGEAVKSMSAPTISGLFGPQRNFDTEQIARAGIGGGISAAAQELQRFYLDLAKQTMPVIEVGATRTITLVVSEGVHLEINEYCLWEEGKC